MGEQGLSIGVVFLAGLVSFLSPCVLPVIPAYLTLVSGASFEELRDAQAPALSRWRLFASALAFIAGFSVVTVLMLGGMASLLARAYDTLTDERMLTLVRWVGFVVIVVFAAHLLGLFRIKALYNERRFHLTQNAWGIPGAALIGAAFGFGWTPCIGPILGSVLLYASGGASPEHTWWLLVAYTLGLAIPFLLAAVFVNLFLSSLRKLTQHMRVIEITSGALLLGMGIMLVTNNLALISDNAGVLRDLSSWVEGLIK